LKAPQKLSKCSASDSSGQDDFSDFLALAAEFFDIIGTLSQKNQSGHSVAELSTCPATAHPDQSTAIALNQ
jgi:hypothetical protein